MSDTDEIATERLVLRRLTEEDAGAMAALLADPHVAIRIMCDASSPEKCLEAASARIAWFNTNWEAGYGVRAVMLNDPALGAAGELAGWCGAAGFAGSQGEPELLYGLARRLWGKGLIPEAARAAVADFHARTREPGLCAIIFEQLNANSVRVARKLGFTLTRRIALADFVPDEDRRRQGLDYALWCAALPQAREEPQLFIDAATKAGLLAGSGVGDAAEARMVLRRAAGKSRLARQAETAFTAALANPTSAYFSLARQSPTP